MQPDETQYAKTLLTNKPNYQVFRTDQGEKAADFILVDMSNPKKLTGYVLDLKMGGGDKIGGATGDQFTKAGIMLKRMGLDPKNFKNISGTSQAVINYLKK